METAIGVFASRDRAEEAVRELKHHVSEDSIVFLTRSENEAKTVGTESGAFVGGFTGGAAGMSAGVVAATLLVPGLGPVFALGFGAAALLGVAGAGAGAALGKAIGDDSQAVQPTPSEKCSENAAFFREVLKEERSLIVVRTESKDLATLACGVLDRLGLGMRNRTPDKMQTTTRSMGDIAILDISGRITVGEGNRSESRQRSVCRQLRNRRVVRTHTTVRNQGRQLRLVNLNKQVNDLLQMTKLPAVFGIESDEPAQLGLWEALLLRRLRAEPASPNVVRTSELTSDFPKDGEVRFYINRCEARTAGVSRRRGLCNRGWEANRHG